MLRRKAGFLRIFTFLFTVFLSVPAFAAYTCPTAKTYTSCNSGYYLSNCGSQNGGSVSTPTASGNSCLPCPSGKTCAGGLNCPVISLTCPVDQYSTNGSSCTGVGNGYYSPVDSTTRTACTNGGSGVTYTSTGGGTNNCKYTKTESCTISNGTGSRTVTYDGSNTSYGTCYVVTCNTDYWSSSGTSGTSCATVGNGYYSPNGSTSRTACTNSKPSNSSYSGSGNGTNNCPWSCNTGYVQSGSSCISANTVIILSKNGGTGTMNNYNSNSSYTSTLSDPGSTSNATLTCDGTLCEFPTASGVSRSNSGKNDYYGTFCTTSATTGGTCYTGATYYTVSSSTTLYLRWTCNTGYYQNSSYTACLACTNTKPSNSSYSGPGVGTSNNCPWACNTGYHEESGACVIDARSCSAGTYWNGSSCASCGGNTYYCPGFTNVANPATGYGRNTVSSGYYTTGGTTTTRTGQSQCTGATYCSGGVQNSCPTGYTANTTAGKTAASQCQISCAAGTKVATANAACTTPAGNWYSAAHTVNYTSTSTGIGNQTCPANYTVSLAANNTALHDAQTDCQISCAAGTRVVSPNEACTTPPGGWFTAAHNVGYGNTSPVNYCMVSYDSAGTTTAAHDAATDCTATIAAGEQVTANTVQARYIRYSNNGNAISNATALTEIQAFASRDGTGTNLLSGKYASGATTCGACATDGNWNTGNYTSNAALKGTLTFDMGGVNTLGSIVYGSNVDRRAFNGVTLEVSTDGTIWTTVMAKTTSWSEKMGTDTNVAWPNMLVLSAPATECGLGYARSANTSVTLGSTLSCTSCSSSSYADTTGQATCTSCPKTPQNGGVNIIGYQPQSDGLHDSPYECWTSVPWNTVQESGTAHGTGKINCYYLSGADGSAQYGDIVGNDSLHHNNSAYNATGAGICDNATPQTCDAGYYYEGNRYKSSCVPVGAGYYSPADEITRTQCPPLPGKTMNYGSPTVSSPTNATDVTQCYVTGTSAYERLDVGYGMWKIGGINTCNWDGSDYLDCDKTYNYCEFGHYIDNTESKGPGYTNSCKPCAAGTYNKTLGAQNGLTTIDGTPVVNRTKLTACNNCLFGKYQDQPGQADCINCPTASYAPNWVSGYGLDQYGSYANPSSNKISPNACHLTRSLRDAGKALHGDGTSLYWYTSGTDNNAIYAGGPDTSHNKITSCDAGYWLANPKDTDCAPVTPGYWSSDGPVTRTECTNKPTSSHYTDALATTEFCAWECDVGYVQIPGGICAAICPHAGLQTLRVGSLSIPMYQEKHTEHAIAVKYNDNICYTRMESGNLADALNVNIGGTIYHTIQ